jgi:23S rRNA (cytidine2498-2'-O)-methyltransferase
VYAPDHAGRARLITAKLPYVSGKPLTIGDVAPSAPLGSWTLLKPGLVLAAARCSDPFANGAPRLDERRVGPPSRAYLKLWEALARARRWPAAGERCLDLGASPGGWTWLAAQTGAMVTAVDKAPLADEVSRLSNVRWRQGSAFALDPADHPPIEWLFSDIICYPGRLLGLLQKWIESGSVRNVVATIKFQGPTDHAVVAQFAAIPGADVRHLHHNKHELTFTLLDIG